MTEGKGGTAPNNGRTGKSVISGFARVMNLNNINLEDATALAEQNFEHPKSVFLSIVMVSFRFQVDQISGRRLSTSFSL